MGMAFNLTCKVQLISCPRFPVFRKRTRVLIPAMSLDHRDQPLTCKVDPRLSTNHHFPEEVPVEIQRPPGINTLREWGFQPIPSGKHVGKTFEEAHTDLGYVKQLKNRKAVSAWVRSFQMYCRARSKIEYAHALQLREQGIEVDLTDLHTQVTQPTANIVTPTPKPMSRPASSTAQSQKTPAEAEEWITIEEETKIPKETSRNSKRGRSKAQPSKPGKMAVEPNTDRVQALRTQIAILERELAREVQIPEEEDI